jgi:hypothetical protein
MSIDQIIPAGSVIITRIEIVLAMHPDTENVGVFVNVDGQGGTVETVGLIELAKLQYITGQSQGPLP